MSSETNASPLTPDSGGLSIQQGGFSYTAPDDEDDDLPVSGGSMVPPSLSSDEQAGAVSLDFNPDSSGTQAYTPPYDSADEMPDSSARDDTPDDTYEDDAYEDSDEDAEDADDEDADGMYSIQRQFSTAFDLIDAMIAEITDAPSQRFRPDMARISRSSLLGELNQLKDCLPRQLNDASAMMRRADQQLDEARTQARAIQSEAHAKASATIQAAEERADEIASQQNIVAMANAKAQEILNNAQKEADRITIDADEYTISIMNDLNRQLRTLTTQVTEGTAAINEHRDKARQDLEKRSDANGNEN